MRERAVRGSISREPLSENVRNITVTRKKMTDCFIYTYVSVDGHTYREEQISSMHDECRYFANMTKEVKIQV